MGSLLAPVFFSQLRLLHLTGPSHGECVDEDHVVGQLPLRQRSCQVVEDVLAGDYDIESRRRLAAIEDRLQQAARSNDSAGLLAAAREITQVAPGRATSWEQLFAIMEHLKTPDEQRLQSLDEASKALASHPGELVQFAVGSIAGSEFVAGHAGRLHAPLAAALKAALPELPPDELIWRFLFMVGAMAHTMALSDDVHRMSGGACDPGDVEGTIRRLVPFLCAGLSSPVTQLTTPEA